MRSCCDCSDGSFGGKRGTECPPEWQAEAPVQTVEPVQNTPEAVQSEPARPGKKVNMDDTKWADAIEELNDYIDQQIGGDKK